MIGRRLRPLLGAFFAFATLLAATAPASAEVRTWDPTVCGFGCDWQIANNWDPVGVPAMLDDVFINTGGLVLLSDDTEFLNTLDLTGTTLLAQGFMIDADTMTIRGFAEGAAGSVVIDPNAGVGLFAHSLRIAFGGLLTLDVAGSEAVVSRREMTIDFGGEFRAHGAGSHQLIVNGGSISGVALNNNGTISTSGGTLSIDAREFMAINMIDLDGEFEIGIVNISSGATLEFLGFQPSDDFGGTINVGGGGVEPGVLVIGRNAPWTIGPGGVVTLDNGEISSELLTSEGDLRGNGSLMTEVRNHGGITPGLSAGSLHIELDYTQFSGGTLGIELGGLSAGSDCDVLSVGGAANLDGTLDVSLVGEFQPTIGDESTILTAAGVIPGTGQLVEGVKGEFDAVNLPTLDGGLGFDVIYYPRDVVL